MDSTVKPGNFVVPKNYKEEQIEENSEPWLEDLEDEDVEIWFMQAPPSVDISKIQGMPMNLSGKTYFQYDGLLGDSLESSVTPSASAKNDVQFSLLAPSREDKKFRVVKKPFAGHILLTESFKAPLSSFAEETNQERSDYPEKLKQKCLFGSYFVPNKESLSSSKKKKKESRERENESNNSIVFSSSDAEIIQDNEVKIEHKFSVENGELNNESSESINLNDVEISNTEAILAPSSSGRKEKHKKKKKEKYSKDILEEPSRKIISTTSAENSDVESFKKPKSKSEIKIKEEVLSSDADGFNSVENVYHDVMSRKKNKKKKKRKEDYYSDDSTETIPNNYYYLMDTTTDDRFDVAQDSSQSMEKVKKKKKKKDKIEIKEEPVFSDQDESCHQEVDLDASFIKEEYDSSQESSSKSKSLKSSSKHKKSRDLINSFSEISEERELIVPSSASKRVIQGEDFDLNEALQKSGKSQKKEKRKKKLSPDL